MARISIEVTQDQHRKLKAIAALRGQSMKDLVIECTLGGGQIDPTIVELERLLDQRLERVAGRGVSGRTVEEIFAAAREEADRTADA